MAAPQTKLVGRGSEIGISRNFTHYKALRRMLPLSCIRRVAARNGSGLTAKVSDGAVHAGALQHVPEHSNSFSLRSGAVLALVRAVCSLPLGRSQLRRRRTLMLCGSTKRSGPDATSASNLPVTWGCCTYHRLVCDMRQHCYPTGTMDEPFPRTTSAMLACNACPIRIRIKAT
jgi:hypothetical protein